MQKYVIALYIRLSIEDYKYDRHILDNLCSNLSQRIAGFVFAFP